MFFSLRLSLQLKQLLIKLALYSSLIFSQLIFPQVESKYGGYKPSSFKIYLKLRLCSLENIVGKFLKEVNILFSK